MSGSISVFNVFGCLGPELHIGISTQLTTAQEKDYKFFNMVIGITFWVTIRILMDSRI